MKETIERRVEGPRAEFEKGEERMRELTLEQSRLQESLLRIQGAMMVLRELLDKVQPDEQLARVSKTTKAQDRG